MRKVREGRQTSQTSLNDSLGDYVAPEEEDHRSCEEEWDDGTESSSETVVGVVAEPDLTTEDVEIRRNSSYFRHEAIDLSW